MIRISSDRLAVELLAPGSDYYHRTRFDWTGFITQVTLDDTHTFCVPESLIPGRGTGGIGLCSEFGSATPVGYDEAEPGEQFPKLGIGLLTKVDNSDYSPFYPYAVQPFPMRSETEPSAASFIVEPIAIRGYAARLLKRVSADGNRLIVHSRLENVGERRITTQEYNHNFVGIDDTDFGPDFELTFPFDVHSDTPPPFSINGGKITWPSRPNGAYCHGFTGFEGHAAPYWELKQRSTGVTIREQTDFEWVRCVFFGTEHLVSAEVFVAIDIAPGESCEWTRTYTFG